MISFKGIAIKFLLLVVVLGCVFVSGDDATKVRCMVREREALVRFKNGLIDEDGILSSWRGEECCKWYGVECSNTTGHVIKLQLNTTYYAGVLQGNIGSSLLDLHHLSYLDLSWNDFGGNSIPEFIGSMKQLRYLSLWRSNFYGIVPPQIGNLTNLRYLDLSYNSLRIQNLDWLSTLPLLSFLDLSQIDLSHSNWLHQILSLHSLHNLRLQSCSLRDPKSSAVFNSSYTSLAILDLSDNHLTCSSFHFLSNISTSLVKIYLSENALGCSIPDSLIERLVLIEHLDLSSNMFEGQIPTSLSNLSHLRVLDMSDNSLEGPIPNALIEKLVLVEHLDLSSNMLEGEIPKSLVNLSHLHVLVLYDNHLRGRLDELFGNISDKGILGSLEIMDLARNQFSGLVPDLRAFSALAELYLGANNFTGSIPLSIGQLSNLLLLDLSNNSLEGVVSESHFMKLDKLKRLDLSSNSLVLHIAPDWNPPCQLDAIFLASCIVGPSFPKWIQSQKSLSALDLSTTGITDEIPRWLWSVLPSLNYLILSHNRISGTIPNLSSTSISLIDLSNNTISGPIPLFNANARGVRLSGNMFIGTISSICIFQHDQLRFLDLSNNQLAGEVPNCWEKMPNLDTLNLDDNNFSGQIPPSLGSIHDLRLLQLHGNNLSGELPSTLRFCPKLEMVDVGGNELTGDIPSWISNLSEIRFLNLGRNKLHGSVPPEICNLTHIRIMDFSVNNLSGKIPNCFASFAALAEKSVKPSDIRPGFVYVGKYDEDLPNVIVTRYYSYSSFQWKGRELEYRKNLNLLKLIDFSSNRLTGNIPQSFSTMKGLISLNLSRNSLTGNVIPDIGEMEMLECVDLSHNQLSGKIPTSMAKLQSLAVLDLSNNDFSGKIPTGTQLQSFDASAYAGNGLCGPPLALCPEDSLRPTTTNQDENKNERVGGLSFMQEVGISIGFGFIFGFWGVIGSLILKKSWRIAFFNFFDDVGDWFYVRAAIFLSKMKWRPS